MAGARESAGPKKRQKSYRDYYFQPKMKRPQRAKSIKKKKKGRKKRPYTKLIKNNFILTRLGHGKRALRSCIVGIGYWIGYMGRRCASARSHSVILWVILCVQPCPPANNPPCVCASCVWCVRNQFLQNFQIGTATPLRPAWLVLFFVFFFSDQSNLTLFQHSWYHVFVYCNIELLGFFSFEQLYPAAEARLEGHLATLLICEWRYWEIKTIFLELR